MCIHGEKNLPVKLSSSQGRSWMMAGPNGIPAK